MESGFHEPTAFMVAFGARHHGKRFSRTDSINHTNAKSRVKRSNASRLMRASRQNHATDECGRSGQAMFANSRRLPTNSVYRQTPFTDRLRVPTNSVCRRTPFACRHRLQGAIICRQTLFRAGLFSEGRPFEAPPKGSCAKASLHARRMKGRAPRQHSGATVVKSPLVFPTNHSTS